MPVIGVGLLYQQGYFRQVLDAQGAQRAVYPYNDPGQLPITPVRDQDGEWVRLEVALPGYKAWVRAWQVQVGRATLYLLDRNDPANPPALRGITSELYGGGPELRLLQEIILGIGGWRLLRPSGCSPRSVSSTKGTPPSPCWNGRGASWRTTACRSTSPSRSRAPATSSPPIRPSKPGSIGSRRPSSNSTWALRPE